MNIGKSDPTNWQRGFVLPRILGKPLTGGASFPVNIGKIDPPHSVRLVKAAMRLDCLLGQWGVFTSEGEQDA